MQSWRRWGREGGSYRQFHSVGRGGGRGGEEVPGGGPGDAGRVPGKFTLSGGVPGSFTLLGGRGDPGSFTLWKGVGRRSQGEVPGGGGVTVSHVFATNNLFRLGLLGAPLGYVISSWCTRTRHSLN